MKMVVDFLKWPQILASAQKQLMMMIAIPAIRSMQKKRKKKKKKRKKKRVKKMTIQSHSFAETREEELWQLRHSIIAAR